LSPAPFDSLPQQALLNYLVAGGAWTGGESQVSTRAAGLARLLVASSEYPLERIIFTEGSISFSLIAASLPPIPPGTVRSTIAASGATSTRTRSSFEVAAFDQGAHVTYMDPTGSQMGHKESVADTARVLGRMYDAIEFRGNKQEDVEALYRELAS
jgi:hypothetical protein